MTPNLETRSRAARAHSFGSRKSRPTTTYDGDAGRRLDEIISKSVDARPCAAHDYLSVPPQTSPGASDDVHALYVGLHRARVAAVEAADRDFLSKHPEAAAVVEDMQKMRGSDFRQPTSA